MTESTTYRSRYGAWRLDTERARFAVWAPDCEAVWLEIDDQAPRLMQRDARGDFVLELPCVSGARYRYRISSEQAVPDPASRLQASDVHDASVLTDADAYRWVHHDWRGRPWEETVLYELHVGACGGFAGLRRRLAELAELGVTAIELMPIADFSGQRNWGYDGVLPYAPDRAYGPPEALKALIDEAHGLGIGVFLDVVYNHFGPDGNYLHAYASSFFDAQRHSPWGAAIDFSRPQVRRYFIDNAMYWLHEFRFDGLRFDAVHAVEDGSFLDELATAVRASVPADRHVHLVLENEHNDVRLLESGYDAQWNDDGHNILHVLLTGEVDSYYSNYVEQPTQRLARFLSEGFAYQGEAMASLGGRLRGAPSAHLPPSAFVLFLQNHDQIGNRAMGERLTMLAEPDALDAARVLQLLCPQIPLLFMGEECGSTQPFLFFTDFHDELADAVREGRRREFAAFPAFSDPQARERIPDPNAARSFLDSIPEWGRCSATGSATRNRYRWLLELRRRWLIPGLRNARSTGAEVVGDRAVRASWRLGDGTRWTLAVNLGAECIAGPALSGNAVAESRAGVLQALSQGLWPALSCGVLRRPAEVFEGRRQEGAEQDTRRV